MMYSLLGVTDPVTLGVIFGFITGLFTLACGAGVKALIDYRKDRRVEVAEEAERERTGHEVLITDLKQRVTTLEQDLKAVQHDHLECVKSQEHFRGENIALHKEVEMLNREIQSIREWRHALANTIHTETLKKAVAMLPPDQLGLGQLTPPSTEHTG